MKDLQDIEKAFSDISEKRSALTKLHEEIVHNYVFDRDIARTEANLRQLERQINSEIATAKDLAANIKNKYISEQQLVPSDIAQALNQLELLTETLTSAMDEKEKEFKKARTVRTDYLADVEEVQGWIKDAELKVQDRSSEPHILHEHLQQIQTEIGGMADRLEKLTRNGKQIIEHTRDPEEKEMVQSTINNLTDQLQQVRAWLDEKKQQVGETLDAWQRFLSLYQAVMEWVKEKKDFLKDPLYLSSLQEAKQKLHDYSVSYTKNKHLFGINLNISERCQELQECNEELK